MKHIDRSDLRMVSFLYETSYEYVAIYESKEGLWKGHTIQDEALKQRYLPLLIEWKIHVCCYCNHWMFLFPYQKAKTLFQIKKEVQDFELAITYLQSLFLTLQKEQPPTQIASILCDQKNLAYGEDGNWNLYGAPKLEQMTKGKQLDERCWQRLCSQWMEEIRMQTLSSLPIPDRYQTCLTTLQQDKPLTYDEILCELTSVQGCFENVLPPPKRIKGILHRASLILLIVMVVLSILFFAYKYQKEREEYFNEIDTIGDVKVNPDE